MSKDGIRSVIANDVLVTKVVRAYSVPIRSKPDTGNVVRDHETRWIVDVWPGRKQNECPRGRPLLLLAFQLGHRLWVDSLNG